MPIKSAHWSYTDNGDGTTDHFLLGPDGVRSDVPVFAKDASGNVTGLVGAGGVFTLVKNDNVPVIVIGGDHSYAQWGTPTSPGMGKAYLDHGITPYIAINADTQGVGGNLTWEEVAALKTMGVEVVSHGYNHVQAWERQNTGIQIRYTGSNASASVHVQTVAADTVITLTDSGATPITVTGLTLAEAKALIDAVTGWSCTIAPELTGSESAVNMLRLASARAVKTAGSEVVANTYFACGAGIQIQYTGTSYRHAWFRRKDTGGLEIYGDGKLVAAVSLSAASYDTLAELVAYINTLTGFVCKLFDNDLTNVPTARNYVLGDELSLNLSECRYQECLMRPAALFAGLPTWYMVERQFAAAKTTAAANGITLNDFAQSGGEIYPWTLNGHTSYGFHRIETYNRSFAPKADILSRDVNWMPHNVLSPRDSATTPYSRAALLALVDALASSPGWCANVLVHGVIPDGSNEIAYPALVNAPPFEGGDCYEDDWFALLAAIKEKVDAGELECWTLEKMRKYRKFKEKPRNLLFNATFKNTGGSLVLSAADSGRAVPGWFVSANDTHAVSCAITDGVFEIESTATAQTTVLQAEVDLDIGKTYEIGVMVERESAHATLNYSAFTLVLQPKSGLPLDVYNNVATVTSRHGAAIATSTDVQHRMDHVTFRVSVPSPKMMRFPYVVGGPALTTLDLSVNKNIKITIYGKTALDDIDCSAGAANASAVTPHEIVQAINAALAASSVYGADYANVASARDGKIVLTAPRYSANADPLGGATIVVAAATTASAFVSIFGNNTFMGVTSFSAEPTIGTVLCNLAFMTGYGITKISAPYVCEVLQDS